MTVWLAALALLAAAIDFSQRIYVGRDAALRSFVAPPEMRLPPARDAKTIDASLTAWVPVLARGAGTAVDPSNPDAWDLSLAGVFRERSRVFAAIIARPRGGGGTAQTTKVTEGDVLFGFTVASIGRDSVLLQGEGMAREMKLYPSRAGNP